MDWFNKKAHYLLEYVKANSILKIINSNPGLVISPIVYMFDGTRYNVSNDLLKVKPINNESLICGVYVSQRINFTNTPMSEFVELLKEIYQTNFSELEVLIEKEKNIKVSLFIQDIQYDKSNHELKYLILVNRANRTTNLKIKEMRTTKRGAVNGSGME